MPGYIEQTLNRFQHHAPPRPQHSPYAWIVPNYGTATQWAIDAETSPLLPATELQTLQKVVGTLLYYARAVDNTMLVAINTLASVQAQGAEATMDAAIHLLNYCATHPNATVRYTASDMILHVHSDASYLSVHGARYPSPPQTTVPSVCPVHVNSIIMQHIMPSATEAEFGALFHNCKDAKMLRTILNPATPAQAENARASGIANDTVNQKRSRATDMRFYWVRDRVRQDHFHIFWAPGTSNRADYYTKHFAPSHHRLVRSDVFHLPSASSVLQGFVDPFPRQPFCLA
jgi:hypothetical protein